MSESTLAVSLSIVAGIQCLLFVSFLFQCARHKKRQRSNTFVILTTIACITIGLSLATQLVYVSTITLTKSVTLRHAAEGLSVCAGALHLFFLVWRLKLVFSNSVFEVSWWALLLYHILIFLTIACVGVSQGLQWTDAIDYDQKFMLYLIANLLRLGTLFGVSFQFCNKLLRLIVSQHTVFLDEDDSYIYQPEDLRNVSSFSESRDAICDGHMELVKCITRLTLLAMSDFFVVAAHTFLDHLDAQASWGMRCAVTVAEYLMLSSTMWLSFVFADRVYMCLCGACQALALKWCLNIATNRVRFARSTGKLLKTCSRDCDMQEMKSNM